MNGACRKALSAKDILEVIARTLGFDENQNQAVLDGQEKTHHVLNLVLFLYVLDSLRNIVGCGTDTTDSQKNVIAKEIAGKALNVLWECSAEHHSLAILSLRHARLFDNAADLGLDEVQGQRKYQHGSTQEAFISRTSNPISSIYG